MRFAPPITNQASKEYCLICYRQASNGSLQPVEQRQPVRPGIWGLFKMLFAALFLSLSLAGADAYAQQTDLQNSANLQLAQNTTIGQSQTPRVISKPQTVTAEDETAAEDTRATSATTESTNTANDTVADIMNLLPQEWRSKIEQLTGSSSDGSDQDLVRKIALPALGVLAAILILPFVLGALLKRIFRRRPAHASSASPIHDERLAELDLDSIDFSASGAGASPDAQRTAEAVGKETEEVRQSVAPAAEVASVEGANTMRATSTASATGVTESGQPGQQYPGYEEEPLSADSTMVLDNGYGEDSRTLTTHPVIDDIEAPEHYNGVTDAAIDNTTNDRIPADAGVSHDLPDVNDVSRPEGIKTMTGMHSHPVEETTPNQAPLPPVAAQQTEPELPRPMTKFGLWLNQLPNDLGSRYSIEALLYWVSYGAGKVKPGLREELNNATELDNHGRIKKAVLTARPEVLNDVLLSVRTNFSSAQQLQILDLMLAVLVTGEGIKPVENLILRFYCDYTGMGLETLERRYREGFNAELPGIPRPDRLKWWDKQALLNVQAATDSSYMLGLEPTASESQFKMALKLAEHRHDPSRFDLLGDKERSLVARNLQKYQAVVESRLETEA